MTVYKNVVRFNTDRQRIGGWVWTELADPYSGNGVPSSSAMLKAADDRSIGQMGMALKHRSASRKIRKPLRAFRSDA